MFVILGGLFASYYFGRRTLLVRFAFCILCMFDRRRNDLLRILNVIKTDAGSAHRKRKEERILLAHQLQK